MPRHHDYSQHFLRNPRLVAELVGHSNLRKRDLVYDLGAGSGVITSVLAKRCRQVMAVELEPDALARLRRNTAGLDNVTILARDLLSVRPGPTAYKIFANPPFAISARLVRHFLFAATPPTSLYLITQRQFARKLTPGDDHFTGQLSAEIGPWFVARIRRPLRRSDFTPPPAVDTVLLEIKPRQPALLDRAQQAAYRGFVTDCFARQASFRALDRAAVGIAVHKRPSQLSLTEWVALFTAYGLPKGTK